jgi:hypothetical protein
MTRSRIAALVSTATLIGGFAGIGLMALPASALQVPPSGFTCGVTVFTPCNESAHFSDITAGNGPEVASPAGATPPGCPAFIGTDAAVIVATGNGVEHSIINNAGDGWFTSTFTGTASVTFWTVDGSGKPVALDPLVPSFTGHIEQWFGGSFNKSNYVLHDTTNVAVTGFDGSSLSFHAVNHFSTSAVATAAPNQFSFAHC